MAPTTTTPPGPTPEATPRPRRRVGRWLALGALVGVLGMWAYVFGYHLSGAWRDDTPGRIDDPTWGQQAEVTCAAARAQLDALPPAAEAADATERAEVIDRSDVILSAMLADLSAQALPADPDDAARVDEWLADWSTYVADRAAYADRLREDADARFFVTQSERDQGQITKAVDRFAVINEAPSCQTPSDIA